MADTVLCHWNMRGYRTNYLHLRTMLADTQAVVSCLQETRMPAALPDPPRGFVMHHVAGPAADDGLDHGGVCTLVKQNISHVRIQLTTDLQAVAVRCHLDRQYTVCNIYIPPREQVSSQQLDDLLSQLPPPYLLVGDFNARHPLWGDDATNQRGRLIEAFLHRRNCCILNQQHPTHFHSQTATLSSIDLSLSSPEIVANFGWAVSDCLYNSDHFPVLLSVPTNVPLKRTPRYIFDRADWPAFRIAALCDRDVASFASVDEAVAYFNQVIIYAANESIPKTRDVLRTKEVPWWNVPLNNAVRDKKFAMRRYYASRLVADKIAFQRARARARYLLKISQAASWKKYVSSLNERTPMSAIWQKIGKIRGKHTGLRMPALDNDGVLLTDPHDVGNSFGQALSDVTIGSSSPAFHRIKRVAESRRIQFPDGEEDYNSDFSLSELRNALKISANTATGNDEISYSMLRNLSPVSQLFLLSLYNRIWHEHTFPTEWSLSVILPFRKPGKDGTQPLHYRPIALTSCICKVMERMVNIRLVWNLERDDVFHPNQYGFRKCRSTTDVLVRVDTFIKTAFSKKEHVAAVFFDLEKAYDKTWKHHILKVIKDAGFVGRLPRFLQNFLSNRVMRVRIGHTLSDPFPQHEGVPQGSVLSCTLFVLALNGLPSCLPQYVENSLYVDDFAIFVRSASLPMAERRIQLAINKAFSWAVDHGFTFSASKTVAMHFTRTRGVFPALCLSLNGTTEIPHVSETKFLGLVFDSKLTWVPHLRALRRKCTRSLDIMKCLSRLSWGADRATLLRIYRAIIRSQLDYGCQLYVSATHTSLKMLDPIHHQGLRLATGAFRTSPMESLYAETGEPSLSDRRRKLSLQLYARLLGMPGTPACTVVNDRTTDNFYLAHPRCSPPFGYRMRQLCANLDLPNVSVMPSLSYHLPLYDLHVESLCPGIIYDVSRDTPPDVRRLLFVNHAESHQPDTPIYTDGSKGPDGVAGSVVLPTRTVSRKLPLSASVFSAELFAILFALFYLLGVDSEGFIIYSDSQSALSSICDSFCVHPVVAHIHRWLDLLRERRKRVRFCWVPSHVNIEGNEQADDAARATAASDQVPDPRPLPFRDYYPHMYGLLKEQWLQRWRNQTLNKLRSIKDTVTPWHTSHRTVRRDEVLLARLRIGHTRLTHKCLLDGDPAPFCDGCLVPLTVEHILTECPDYIVERRTHFGADGVNEHVNLQRVLRDDETAVRAVLGFVTSIGLSGQL